MSHILKYSSSGRMKISAGYKPGNMAAFMHGSTKRKRKKRVRGKMTTITLKNGYYIEIDPLNYTLRQKFKGQTREGQEKDSVRTCGYFGNIRSAITEYLNLIQLEVMHDEVISMQQYVDAVEKSNALALRGIAEELRRFPVK